jgi:hypothetical protein
LFYVGLRSVPTPFISTTDEGSWVLMNVAQYVGCVSADDLIVASGGKASPLSSA